MPSHDASWRIERYPNGDGTFSYGCPDLNLMGYDDVSELCLDITLNILAIEAGDKDG